MKKESTLNYEQKIQDFKSAIVDSIQTINYLQTHLVDLNSKKQGLLEKTQIKSESQILLESLFESEENYRKVLSNREETITLNEKNINDLRNKLQVK